MEFRERFSDEDTCFEYLAKSRWPEGFTCPRCGMHEFWINRVDTFMSVKHVDVKPRLQRELFYTDLMFLLESGSGLRILSLRIPQGLVRNSCSDK